MASIAKSFITSNLRKTPGGRFSEHETIFAPEEKRYEKLTSPTPYSGPTSQPCDSIAHIAHLWHIEQERADRKILLHGRESKIQHVFRAERTKLDANHPEGSTPATSDYNWMDCKAMRETIRSQTTAQLPYFNNNPQLTFFPRYRNLPKTSAL